MNDTETDAAPSAAACNAALPNRYLGFRIAVGAAALALIVLFAMLGSVAMKQSATAQALENRETLGDEALPAPVLPTPARPAPE